MYYLLHTGLYIVICLTGRWRMSILINYGSLLLFPVQKIIQGDDSQRHGRDFDVFCTSIYDTF